MHGTTGTAMEAASTLLYHFTSPERLVRILQAGEVRTTDLNFVENLPRSEKPYGERYAPDVVWLTSDPAPAPSDIALEGTLDGTDKTSIRLTLLLPFEDVLEGGDFAERYRIHPKWKAALERGRAARTWFVLPRPALLSEVVAVDERRDGTYLPL